MTEKFEGYRASVCIGPKCQGADIAEAVEANTKFECQRVTCTNRCEKGPNVYFKDEDTEVTKIDAPCAKSIGTQLQKALADYVDPNAIVT